MNRIACTCTTAAINEIVFVSLCILNMIKHTFNWCLLIVKYFICELLEHLMNSKTFLAFLQKVQLLIYEIYNVVDVTNTFQRNRSLDFDNM